MNWTPVSTFADVYFEDVSAPLESICYLGPHAWYFKENETKKQDKKEERKNNKNKYRHSMQRIYAAIKWNKYI